MTFFRRHLYALVEGSDLGYLSDSERDTIEVESVNSDDEKEDLGLKLGEIFAMRVRV